MRKFKKEGSRKNGAILKQRRLAQPKKSKKPILKPEIFISPKKRRDLCNERYPRRTIFPRHIASIMRVHLRTAQKIIRNMRFLLGKGKMAYVTVKEFCTLNGLNEEKVQNAIDNIDRGINTFEASKNEN